MSPLRKILLRMFPELRRRHEMREFHNIYIDHARKTADAGDDWKYMRFEGTSEEWHAFLDKHGEDNVKFSGGHTKTGPDGTTVGFSIFYNPHATKEPEE